MAEHEIVHVAIAPPDTLDANLVRSVAGVINKSPYVYVVSESGKTL